MAERLALFKAAKAQRGSTPALTKEQIKALKAQKAKAAIEADEVAWDATEQRHKHEMALKMASAAAASRQRDASLSARPSTSGAMPPPAPRLPPTTASVGNGSIGSTPAFWARRTESQMTRVGRNASIAPEPAGQSNASSGAVHSVNDANALDGEEKSIGSLPQGFFDGPADSGGLQESVGTGEIVGSNLEVNSEVASALPRGSSVEAMSARTQVSGLPNDFFEAAASNDGVGNAGDVTEGSSQPLAPPVPDKPNSLPRGFFEDKEADAKAHGIAPPKKKTKEEAFTDFMTSVAADVRDVEEREQEEAVRAAQERADREAFEQRMRLERIEKLKEGQSQLPQQFPQSEAVAPKLDPTVMPKPKKQKTAANDEMSGSDDNSDFDEEAEMNWRAKGL